MVRELGMSFRAAHHASGKIVAKAAAAGVDLAEMHIADMQAIEPRIKANITGLLKCC